MVLEIQGNRDIGDRDMRRWGQQRRSIEELHVQGKEIRYILCLRRELGSAQLGWSTIIYCRVVRTRQGVTPRETEGTGSLVLGPLVLQAL